MVKQWLIGLLVLGALGVGFARMSLTHPRQSGTHLSKEVIGPTEWVEIPEAGLGFLGRVDTGAASTSVHAESIKVEDGMVSFVLVNRAGRRVPMRAPLVKTREIRNAEASEKRVFVELTVVRENRAKRVLANLNDRSGLTYAMLLGRNWLQDDFVVDVARGPGQPPESLENQPSVAEDSRGMASR